MGWVVAGIVVYLCAMNTFLVLRLVQSPRRPEKRVVYRDSMQVDDVQRVTEYLHGDTDEVPDELIPVGLDG